MARFQPMIVANWKMYPNLADAMVLSQSIKGKLEDLRGVDVVLAPPSVWLYPVGEVLSSHRLPHLFLAAQNMHQSEEGAYTGEISAPMLRSLCRYVLIGHSERRQFGEDPEIINQKIRLALKWGLEPIVFVSEERHQSDPKKTLTLAERLLEGVAKKDFQEISLVYEPSWAVSTSTNSHPAAAHDVEAVTSALKNKYGSDTRILYGGSVGAQNAAEFLDISDLDGLVVGKESLNLKLFISICEVAAGSSESQDIIRY